MVHIARNEPDGSKVSPTGVSQGVFHEIWIRAPQTPQTTVSGSDTPTTSPFFPDPSTLQPVPPPKDDRGGLAKSVLEYLFLAVAILIVTSVIARRLINMRRSNLPMTAFFSVEDNQSTRPHGFRNFPRTTGLPHLHLNHTGQPYPPHPDPLLAGMPTAYTPGNRSRRTNATDIDSSGRRLGDRAAEPDHDGELDDKDVLPAYDHYGGPPKYAEMELQTRLFGVESRPGPPAEQPANPLSENDDIPPRLASNGGRQDAQGETSQSPPRSSNLDTADFPPTNMTNNEANAARDGA